MRKNYNQECKDIFNILIQDATQMKNLVMIPISSEK
jgi:hypothetical protein